MAFVVRADDDVPVAEDDFAVALEVTADAVGALVSANECKLDISSRMRRASS